MPEQELGPDPETADRSTPPGSAEFLNVSPIRRLSTTATHRPPSGRNQGGPPSGLFSLTSSSDITLGSDEISPDSFYSNRIFMPVPDVAAGLPRYPSRIFYARPSLRKRV